MKISFIFEIHVTEVRNLETNGESTVDPCRGLPTN